MLSIVSMNDCWTVVATFLDIRERGRLYTAVKVHQSWENLVQMYLHTRGPSKLVQKMTQKKCSKMSPKIKLLDRPAKPETAQGTLYSSKVV